MRVLLLERDHVDYTQLLRAAAPDLELLAGETASGDAQTCPVLKRRARTSDAPKEAT